MSPSKKSRPSLEHNAILLATQQWLERAVIGLNLCPFAKSVHVKGQIAYRISHAQDAAQLSKDLLGALKELERADPEQMDTLLLIHPEALSGFLDYVDYLDEADHLLRSSGLEGIVQIASFHPDYQFGDADPGDRANYTNRSPYPMLHLLREESISRAVDSIDDPNVIYERNLRLLREMDEEKFGRLFEPLEKQGGGEEK